MERCPERKDGQRYGQQRRDEPIDLELKPGEITHSS